MSRKLSVKDYEMIINHYGKRVPKTARSKKKKAEDLMALKLCSCIKKITRKSRIKPKNEGRSIGFCSVAVIKNRGMKYKSFTCKKPRQIKNLKKTRNIKFKHPYRKRKTRKKKLLKSSVRQ